MIRYTAEYTTNETNLPVRVEIRDNSFSGSAGELAGTQNWLSYSHQRIEPKTYTEIQKGELTVNVHIQTEAHRTFRNDLLTSSEGRFELWLYFDGEIEWKGTVLPDLCSYTESFDEVLTIRAKDFTMLKGDNFPLSTARETIITTIESILSDFDLPIVTATSWTEANTDSDNDFLRQIYNDRTALRQFTDADQDDVEITNEEALKWILRSYGLTLRQSGGALRLDQFTAYSDPENVLLTTYNGGVSQSVTDVRQVRSPITIDSTNQGVPGIKRVFNTFNHRTQTSVPTIPQSVIVDSPVPFDFNIVPNEQQIQFSASVNVRTDFTGFIPQGGVIVRYQIKAGQYYWDGDEWTTTVRNISQTFTTFLGGVFVGNVSAQTDNLPEDADSDFRITFFPAQLSQAVDYEITQTEFYSIVLELDIEDISEAIRYEIENSQSFTEEVTHPVTYFGDGPLLESPSALRFSTTLSDLTSNSWQRRGGGDDRAFHSNLLHEILDGRRGFRRVLNATIKDTFEPQKVLSYDGQYFYYLGGTFDGYTGNWSVQVVEINVTDAEEQIVELLRQKIPSLFSGVGEFVNVTTRDLRRLLGLTQAVGVTTTDYENQITETLEARLDSPMRVGYDYWVINIDELDWRDRQTGIYQVEPRGAENAEFGTGVVPIEEQIINAPEGSLIVLAPGQQSINENKTDERVREGEEKIEELDGQIDDLELDLEALESNLENLNDVVIPALDDRLDDLDDEIDNLNDVVIPALDSELETLDGYFDDPSSIPVGYGFFTGIVASNVFTEALVAKNAFVEELAARQLFADTIVANNGFINELVTRELFTDTLAARQLFTDALVANSVFTDALVANNVFTDALIAKEAWVDALIANMIDVRDFYSNTATIGAVLTLGSGGKFTNAGGDFEMDADGLSANYDEGVSGLFLDFQTGDAEFNNITIRGSGSSIGDNAVLDDLTINGTLLIDSGKITNDIGSYKILDNGFGVYTASNISTNSSYSVYNANTPIIGDVEVLRIGAAVNASTNEGNAIIESIIGTVGLTIRSEGVSADLSLSSARHFIIDNLPTTNPGGSNRIWKDGGFLRIT